MVKDQNQIDAYVLRGESEVHWLGKKISHFSLLKNLLMVQEFKPLIGSCINRVIEKFDEKAIQKIITNVDSELPVKCSAVKIPEQRKELIYKLVISRFNHLKNLI